MQRKSKVTPLGLKLADDLSIRYMAKAGLLPGLISCRHPECDKPNGLPNPSVNRIQHRYLINQKQKFDLAQPNYRWVQFVMYRRATCSKNVISSPDHAL
jgi:hypothetical protein